MVNLIEHSLQSFPTVTGAVPRKLGYVVNFSFHIWYKVLEEYLRARCRQYGVAEVLVRDARQDLRTELAAVDDLIAHGVDALVVTPVPGPGTEAIVEKATGARIPLVIEANPVSGMSTMVAICDYDAGVKGGQWAGSYLKGHGITSARMLDIGFPSLRPCVLRSEGFLDGLKSVFPEAELAERVNGEAIIDVARRVSKEALGRSPGINVLFAMDDESLHGGLLAAHDLGRSEKDFVAVGFGLAGDGDKDHLLEADAWKASVAMFPEWVGARCVDQAVRLMNGQPVQLHDVVPTVAVPRDAISKYFVHEHKRWYPNFAALLAVPREDRCTRT